jgi:glycosyltransferase involved in cell wall biosynthesis
LTAPLSGEHRPHDHDILIAGCYNLGFLALARHPQLNDFLTWWQRKLEFDCRIDFANGLFVDQKWIDLVPGLFDGVSVLRHPGYNVAYWNLEHRAVRRQGSALLVNSQPLVFFHFSGMDPAAPQNLSKYQDRYRLPDLAEVQALAEDYCRAVRDHGFESYRSAAYAFATWADGTPIPDLVRACYRNDPEAQQLCGDDPFRADHAYLNAPWGAAPSPLVTRLMRAIWEKRVDLQRAFPDICDHDRAAFVDWFCPHGAAEEQIPDRFVAPVRQDQQKRLPAAALDIEQSVPAASDARLQPRSASLARRIVVEPMRAAARAVLPARMRRGLKAVLLSLTGRDQPPGAWQRMVGKLRQSRWCCAAYRRLPGRLRVGLRRLASGEVAAVIGPDAAVIPLAAAPTVEMRVVAEPEGGPQEEAKVEYGMSIAGYVRAEMGIGESSRLAAQACQAVGLPFSMHDFNVGNNSRVADQRWEHKIAAENKYWVNVFHINADQLVYAYEHLGAKFFAGHYNIGYWAWELTDFPDAWVPAFEMVDEVWAPATFVVEAISRKTSVPVLRMPHGVRVMPDPAVRRSDLGLPESKFLFLAMYDTHSFQGRKNPQAAIRAFCRAFPDPKDIALVVKINNPRSFPDQIESLKELVRGHPGVVVLDQILSRQDVSNLESLCDCYLSLHRSEGFGLGLAEAMSLGKPVIGTNWSGNLDFMNPDNSCCVRWKPVAVGNAYESCARGMVWADPDVEHAAWFMARVVNDRCWARELGLRGRETIERDFSPEAVGRMYQARLDAIARGRGKTWRMPGCPDEKFSVLPMPGMRREHGKAEAAA